MESFIAVVVRADERGLIHGVRIAPTAPSVSTLCFADDTLIFCRTAKPDANALKSLLKTYAKASGQVINFEKSSMFFNPGVSPSTKNQIASILRVQVVEKHDKYLGMLAVVGKLKKQIFSVLRDRIWKRINGWGERTLSIAGKEVLIKAVLQSIPTYIMSCFSLPGYLVASIESAIRAFGGGMVHIRSSHGCPGPRCASQKIKAALVLGTCELLTWLSWRSSVGGY